MGGAPITYKQIHEILKKAFNSKPIAYQQPSFPWFEMMGVLPTF
ncbi:MAG: hypothetical protein ACKO96_09640 [Flammeovirgaceae bacterium]